MTQCMLILIRKYNLVPHIKQLALGDTQFTLASLHPVAANGYLFFSNIELNETYIKTMVQFSLLTFVKIEK